MAAELEARHAAVIAIRAVCVRPDAVATTEQRLRTIGQMRGLQALIPSASAKHLAACTQQSANPCKQEVWCEWLEEDTVASR